MKREDDILNELARWGSPLASMSRVMPYTVPENYFEQLSSNIQEITKVENIDAVWGKELPFHVRGDYFNSLPVTMLASVKENAENVNFGITSPFSVPTGYFDALPQQILAAAKTTSGVGKRKIIPLHGHIWRFTRIAAAAILVASLGLGSYTFLASRQQTPELAIARIPTTVISDYAQQNIDDFDVYMKVNSLESNNDADKYTNHLSPQEIEQYLEETSGQRNID